MLSSVLAFALFLVAYVAAQGQTSSVILRTHSISMPYIDDELQNRWFDFGGDTIINTNRQIRLTSTRQSQQGYLWSRLPLTAHDFEIEFEFKVGGSSGHLYGDGFAMWLTKERTQEGTVFGSKDRFEGLGIFFDTYDNERAHKHSFPYISAMLGDGMTPYDNSKDGSNTELAGCEADFRDRNTPTRARLTYYANNYLQMQVQWKDEDTWEECFKVHDVRLPHQPYLGYTAHTGDLSDNHDIISVTTKSIPPKAKEYSKPVSQKIKKRSSGGGFMSFLFKIFLAAGLVGVLFVGYRLYDKNTQMKRF
ncbi:legume-like lectin family-domain-containing protein [Gongronella butleri]|nr:legume-like lectin family-domain-containing protein [Gongronella butleri]